MKKLIALIFALFLSASPIIAFASQINIITRPQWGADESLRVWDSSRPKPEIKQIEMEYTEKFSDELKVVKKVETNSAGQNLTWPLEYPAKVSKIIIHHTDSTKNLDDPELAVRNIYQWHTLSRGWGDIGYNYVIDQQGKIYEGRYGGNGVVGAHAGKSNTGSIGIAILGDYESNDVPEAALLALAKLISVVSAANGINPLGQSEFRGEITPNIIGHKDVMATDCPGKYLYSKLDIIRKLASQKVETTTETPFFKTQKAKGYDYEDLSGFYYLNLNPGESRQITIKIKNTGTNSWDPATTFVANTIDLSNKLSIKVESPHATIAPNQIAQFTVTITAKYVEGLTNLDLAPFISNAVPPRLGGGTQAHINNIKLEKYIGISVNIRPPIYTYEFVGAKLPSGVMQAGAKFSGWVDLKNTGDTPWYKNETSVVRLGTDSPRDRLSQFLEKPDARIGFLQKNKVLPGEIGRFLLNLRAPIKADAYEENFTPVVEGVRWMADKDMKFKVFVYRYPYDYEIYSASDPNIFRQNQKKTVWVKLQNKGSISWTQTGENAINVSAMKSDFKFISARLLEQKVAPGEIGTIEITLEAPKRIKRNYEQRIKVYIGKNLLTRKPYSIPLRVVLDEGKSATKSVANPAQNIVIQPSIKVLISQAPESPIITADGEFKLISGGALIAKYSKADEVSVMYKDNKYSISSKIYSGVISSPPRFEPIDKAILEIKNYENRPEWDTSFNDNRFRGAIEINYYKNQIRVINQLLIEDYLKGLAEISGTDPYEKIKAIMIASRTYAVFYTTKAQKFPGAPYDLDDDAAVSQKYLGYSYELRAPTTVKAETDTFGTVVTYQGEVVKTPYFSSSDGRTRSYKEVWGDDIPYLQSVSDSYCTTGKLSGHGVGLSGCGAKGMAEAGKKYDEILKYYYKGIELKKIY